MKFYLCALFLFAITLGSQAQQLENIDDPGGFKGFAVDLLPVLSSIFSDDSPDRLFSLGYLWQGEKNIYEVTLSPKFSTTSPEFNGVEGDNVTDLGLGVGFSVVRKSVESEKWLLFSGFLVGADYNRLNSTNENGFEINNKDLELAAGALLRFGYAVHERVWLRSELGGVIFWKNSSEEINQGGFPPITGEQKIKTFGFELRAPDRLEIVYLF